MSREVVSEVASRTIKLAVIGGDGIGPEVIAEAVKVLDAVTAHENVTLEKTHFSLGAARFLETGDVLTADDLAAIATHDAILLGAVGGIPGDPRLKDANIERGLLLGLRFSLDHYVNLRPSILFPGVPSPLAAPGVVDFVVVREGTEGPYVGNGGAIRQGTPQEVANEVSVNTAFGVERVVRFAFGVAADRPRKQLADPTAAILSVALMLDHLGLADAAARVSAAVTADIRARSTGSTSTDNTSTDASTAPRSTAAVGDAIVALLTSKGLQ